jgi:hypothetical protein
MTNAIAWTIAGCGSAILLGSCLLHVRTIRIRKFEAAANEFYKNLGVLLKDEDMPEGAIRLFNFANSNITYRWVPHLMLAALLRLNTSNALVNPERKAQRQEVVEYYTERRVELKEPFFMALVYGMYAMTYNSTVFGWLVRRLVLFDLDIHQDRAPDIIASFEPTKHDGLAHA